MFIILYPMLHNCTILGSINEYLSSEFETPDNAPHRLATTISVVVVVLSWKP